MTPFPKKLQRTSEIKGILQHLSPIPMFKAIGSDDGGVSRTPFDISDFTSPEDPLLTAFSPPNATIRPESSPLVNVGRKLVLNDVVQRDSFTDSVTCAYFESKLFVKETKNIDYPELPYELQSLEPISKGTFGTVYKGSYKGNVVAVKRLHTIFSTDRVLNEVVVLKFLKKNQLKHRLRHCIDFYSALSDSSGANISILLSYHNHVHFNHLLRFLRTLPEPERYHLIRSYMRNLLIALSQLHELKVSHRDVKPSNFLFHPDNLSDSCLCDFGLSSLDKRFDNAVHCGTVGFRPPEQYLGFVYDVFKADIFAVGIVLLSFLLGVPRVFERDSFAEYCCIVGKTRVLKKQPVFEPFLRNISRECGSFPLEEWGANASMIPLEEIPLTIEFIRLLIDPVAMHRPHAMEALKHRWFRGLSINKVS
ncbi:hypothetical protein PCE1_001033 [Barthelona sp. PCE]